MVQDGVLRCVVLCCAKVHQATLQYELSLDVQVCQTGPCDPVGLTDARGLARNEKFD